MTMHDTADTPAPRRVGRPRREEADQLDDHILSAAVRSFVERGFNATTIERLAMDCGTTRRSVAHRFEDKDALLMAVADREVVRSFDEILTPATGNPEHPFEELRSVCRNLLDQATSQPMIGLYRVYIGEVGRLPQLSERLIRYNNTLEAGIERVVLGVQQRGRFQHYSAASVATSAIGMMLSNPINRAALGDPQFHDAHRVDLYFSQMWAIFLLMA